MGLRITELTVGCKYRFIGSQTIESTFDVMVKEELKNGDIFLLIQFYEANRRDRRHGEDACVWQHYSPDQVTAFELVND